jgi:hypothetical protein
VGRALNKGAELIDGGYWTQLLEIKIWGAIN